jgi:hypothetical protein
MAGLLSFSRPIFSSNLLAGGLAVPANPSNLLPGCLAVAGTATEYIQKHFALQFFAGFV